MLDTLIMFFKEFSEKLNFESLQRTTLLSGVLVSALCPKINTSANSVAPDKKSQKNNFIRFCTVCHYFLEMVQP